MAAVTVTGAQRAQFIDEGWCLLAGVFSASQCDELVSRQAALREGLLPSPPPGFSPRAPNEWGRSMNQHVSDPVIQEWVLEPRVGHALHALLDEPVEAIQSMYFWRSDSYEGSPGQWHQDATPLPGCVATWIALEDVSAANGTIEFQVGSHARRAVWHEDVLDEAGGTTSLRAEQQLEIFTENEAAGLRSISVDAKKGDVVIFSGRLLHRTGPTVTPGGDKDSGTDGDASGSNSRHVLANHYIPKSFEFWPPLWLTRMHPAASADARAADGRATRFGFGDDAQPKLAVADSPPGAPRAWHAPLTSSQCKEFTTTGLVILPSVLSTAERCAAATTYTEKSDEGGAVAGANASDPPALADALEGRLRAPLESCRGAIAAAREGSMNNGSGRGDGSAECEIWLALDGDTSIDLGAAGSAAVKEGDGVIVNVTAADGGGGAAQQGQYSSPTEILNRAGLTKAAAATLSLAAAAAVQAPAQQARL